MQDLGINYAMDNILVNNYIRCQRVFDHKALPGKVKLRGHRFTLMFTDK